MKEKYSLVLILAYAFIGVGVFFIYVHHVRTVFETRTNFSHLTKLGRETLLRKEDALYFSFYKTIVEGDDFYDGFNKLLNVTTIEYPTSVNVVNRFHVLPEIIIGYFYHGFKYLGGHLEIPIVYCWVTETNVGKDPIVNCDGIGEPFRFYLEFVWFLGGLTVCLMYMYASFLSENFFGGIYAVVLYVIFHKHASKIYDRPVARENFAFPFIFWQIFYLTVCIENAARIASYKVKDRMLMVLKLTILTTISLLCWQFSSIIYATQILFMIESWSFGSFSNSFYFDYSISQFLSSILSYYLSFENRKYFLAWHNGPALALLVGSAFCMYSTRARETSGSSMKNITNGLFIALSSQGALTDILAKCGYTKSEDNPYNVYRDLVLHWGLQRKANFSTTLLSCNPDFAIADFDDYWELVKSLLVKPYCLYGVVLLAKYLRQWRKSDPSSRRTEDIERAKKYALEDFLEENHISMKEMMNKETEKELTQFLELLEQCNYDYERYKEEKKKRKKSKKDEHDDFMNHVKKLKDQISENEKRKEESNRENHKKEEKSSAENKKENSNENKQSQTNSEANTSSTSTTSNAKEAKPEKTEKAKNIIKVFNYHHFYSFVQFSVFTIMGLGVRKLFFLCYTQGCAIVPKLFSKVCYNKQKNIFWTVSIVVFLASIVDPGIQNMKEEYYPVQTDPDDLEHMLEWINLNTEKNAVFGGPVEVIATVHLATGRPIVNHPHLDMNQISDRTESVYSVFSRQQSSEIYNQCTNLKIQYLILTFDDCTNATDFECDILSIWDDMQPAYKKYRQFCTELVNKNIPSFLKVFSSKYYGIVKMFSQSVQLNLKNNRMPEKEM